MGERSTQGLMGERISESWQRDKLTTEVCLYIFKKGTWGDQLRSITFFFFFAPPHPHRLSAISETLSGKEGSPVLGVPINMYCNSLYIEKKNYCKVKFNFTLMALTLCCVLLSVGSCSPAGGRMGLW